MTGDFRFSGSDHGHKVEFMSEVTEAVPREETSGHGSGFNGSPEGRPPGDLRLAAAQSDAAAMAVAVWWQLVELLLLLFKVR